MLLQLLLALGLLLRTSSAAGQCTSWCHWDWEKNCKSSQCSGCVDCVSQRVGRAACDAGIKNDFTYEECDPTCQKATCNMCKCKACVSCGGSPPVAQSRGGCSTTFAVSLDIGGRLEIAVSKWSAGEEITLRLSAGTSATPVSSQGDLDYGRALPTATKTAFGAQVVDVITVPILGSKKVVTGEPTKLLYTLAGHAAKYEPVAECRSTAPLPQPPARPPLVSPPPPPLPYPPPIPLRSPPRSPFASPPPPATHPARESACVTLPDGIAAAPLPTALSSASWSLVMPGVKPCMNPLFGKPRAVWDICIRHGGAETQQPLPHSAVSVNATATTLALFGVRCQAPNTCSFAARMRDPSTNATTAWSPESEVKASRPIAAIPSGAVRLEVQFDAADPVWARWEGSSAQHFQRFAATQMAVSEANVKVTERFGDGAYLVVDLVPSELAVSYLLDRLLSALPGDGMQHVAQVRKVLTLGSTELLFSSSGGVASAYAKGSVGGPSFASLPVAIAFSALCCLFLGYSWHSQQQQSGGRKERRKAGPLHAMDGSDVGSDEESAVAEQVSVRFAASCGEEMELLLPTDGVETPSDLREVIWNRGNALMPRGLPNESKLLITFSDKRGIEKPLTSATLMTQVFEAGRINVTVDGKEEEKPAKNGVEKRDDVFELPPPDLNGSSSQSSGGAAPEPLPAAWDGDDHVPKYPPPPQEETVQLSEYGTRLQTMRMDDDDDSVVMAATATRQEATQAGRAWQNVWEEGQPAGQPPEHVFRPPMPPPMPAHSLLRTDDDEFVVPSPATMSKGKQSVEAMD